MKPLIACSSCQRYIHTTELHCPFCGGAVVSQPRARAEDVSIGATSSSAAPAGKGRSRAAAFAMRTALLAGATSAAVACSDDDSGTRDGEVGGSGGGSARGGASGAPSQAGAANGAGSGGRSGSGSGGSGAQLADAGPGDDEDGGFVPIPIYGGAFPDPMRRARV